MAIDAAGEQELVPNPRPPMEGMYLGARELNTSETRHGTVMKELPEAREAVGPKTPPIAPELAQLNASADRGSQSFVHATFWSIVEILQRSPSSVLSRGLEAEKKQEARLFETGSAEKKQEARLFETGSASAQQQGVGSPRAMAEEGLVFDKAHVALVVLLPSIGVVSQALLMGIISKARK